jgi:hypothetical protein
MPRHIPEDVTLIMLLYVGMAILVATSSPLSPYDIPFGYLEDVDEMIAFQVTYK